MQMYGWK